MLTVAAVVLVLLVAEALHGFWDQISYHEVVHAVRSTPARDLFLALLATAVSYAALTGYDDSALRYVGARVSYRVVAQTSFIAYALSNSIGLGVFTGGAVRMRLYSAAGMEVGKISRVIAFNAIAFGLGIITVGALGLWWDAPTLATLVQIPAAGLRIVSVIVLLAITALVLYCRQAREIGHLRRISVRLPTTALASQQMLWSVIDISASAAVLWLLLPEGSIGFTTFIGFYAAATVLGVISHVPGGLGVFEAVMLVALHGQVPADALAGALVLYRIIYYLVPLLLALLLLFSYEFDQRKSGSAARAIVSLAPTLLAAYTLIVAVMLLVSGVTPATHRAVATLAMHVPLSLVEASHFLSSIIGLLLLFVARGMLMRLDAAWWAGMVLAGLSLLLTLPKGIAISEAVLLASLIVTLGVSHGQFRRKASLLSVSFTSGWLIAMLVILMALVVLLLFAYQDVSYTRQLWWQFEFDGNAPRSLRALVGVTLLALVLALRQLMRPTQEFLRRPDAATLDRAADIVRRQQSSDACLALTGDKQFLFSESGNAFIMFGRQRRTWVALFDPVGADDESAELIWSFLGRARDAGGRGCFYQVRPAALPLYLDAGLRLFKLGEYAYVPLGDFSLQGRQRASLRHAANRAESNGLAFEIVPVERIAEVLDEIRGISDAWLAQRRAAEKCFSVGAFIDDYVLRQPVAVVRREGRMIAFATLMSTDCKTEASIDLMRHLPEMSPGTMDFLFVKLMLYLKAQGFRRFGLGMAPLSGMARHRLAPLWQHFGHLLYARGESFYNFRGLRAFKEKFNPEWEARYLATSGGLTPFRVLADIAALISGSLKGVISK